MRITQNTLFNHLRTQMNANGARLLRAQEQVATQKRINRLSDDSIGGSRLLDFKSSLARSERYLAGIDRLKGLNDVQDSTLTSVNDLLVRAKELVLQESNEVSSTVTTREAARLEASALAEQLLQLANTRHQGQYIFSGFASDTPAFSNGEVAAATSDSITIDSASVVNNSQLTLDDYEIQFGTPPTTFDVINLTTGVPAISGQTYTPGATIAFDGIEVVLSDAASAGEVVTVDVTAPGVYQGDDQVREVEIEDGLRVDENVTGDRLFVGAGASDGVDVFDVMNRLNTALRTNDRAELSALIDDLDSAREQISVERSALGARVNMLESAESRQQDVRIQLESLASQIEDIDIAEAITELNRQTTMYDATLGASARIVQPSLLDFLR